MKLHWIRSVWIGCITILTLGCAAATSGLTVRTTSSGAEEAPRLEAGPVVDESSVRPDINALYFEPDALEKYTDVLESERREVVQRRDEIVDAMALLEGMIVADIGAGTGLFTTEIARRVGDHGAVFGVDIVPAFLDRIRESAKAAQLSNVTVVLGEERATALEDASVDLAFMCDTYHHIEYPQTYMRSLFRTVRAGGALVLIDFERLEGKTNPAVLSHVRADKQAVIDEVGRAGFVLESETELLEYNYYLHFRRP